MEQLEKFVQMQYFYATNAKSHHEADLFFHNAFGAVQWENFRTGADLMDWWDEWREKFMSELERWS